MNVHEHTNSLSLASARDHARNLWSRIQDRESAIADAVRHEIIQAEASRQPHQHEMIISESNLTRRASLTRALIAQRVSADKKIKDLTAEYDRTVATATMYGVARLAELLGDGLTLDDQ